MSTRSIIIWIVAIIVVLVGGYFIFKNMNGGQAAATQTQTATTTPQVQGQDVKVGTGATATPNSVVSVLYVGYLGTISTSTIFDSSAAHGNAPLIFTLGAQGIIAGFQIGVNGMKVGGERMLAIPPTLGYGTQDIKNADGKVVIPANSTLIFDVQLVKVEAATTTPTTPAKTQ